MRVLPPPDPPSAASALTQQLYCWRCDGDCGPAAGRQRNYLARDKYVYKGNNMM